jgi:predicted DNA-binding ribbon-helix-helix protein
VHFWHPSRSFASSKRRTARRLIGKLATDKTKREIFARLASQLRVADVERVVAQKTAAGET